MCVYVGLNFVPFQPTLRRTNKCRTEKSVLTYKSVSLNGSQEEINLVSIYLTLFCFNIFVLHEATEHSLHYQLRALSPLDLVGKLMQ